MPPMDLRSAVHAAAADAPQAAIDALEQVRDDIARLGALDTARRAAHMIGQCAHESARFTHVAESLYYSTPERLMVIFGSHFADAAEAAQFTKNPEKLANRVYAGRLGNGPEASGDGYRFRGRGYLQLTGRANYRTYGERIDIDLEAEPDRASEPRPAWLIAANFLATNRYMGKTAFEWADDDNVEAVTRIVNGGKTGLDERRYLTARALAVLGEQAARPLLSKGGEGDAVTLLQRALAAKGFSPGAIDGDFGTKTETAVMAFQAEMGLNADGVARDDVWAALEPLPS